MMVGFDFDFDDVLLCACVQSAKAENETMDAICVTAGADSEASYNKTASVQVSN